MTSIKCFPKDICLALDSVTTNLEHLEIGDCNYLLKHFASDFVVSLGRLLNLKSLRLENCYGYEWNVIAQSIFHVIRRLDRLTILELINIEFSETVEEELGKCCTIRALLIIPEYKTDVSFLIMFKYLYLMTHLILFYFCSLQLLSVI